MQAGFRQKCMMKSVITSFSALIMFFALPMLSFQGDGTVLSAWAKKSRKTKPKKTLRKRKKLFFLKVALAKGTSKGAPPVASNGPQISLQKVYRIIKKNNLNLRMLRQKILQAEIESAKAWTYLKPQLFVQGSYTRNNVEVKLLDDVLTPRNQLAIVAQMRWLFLNLQTIPIIQMAPLIRKQVRYTVGKVQRDILFGATRLYYGILLAQGLVKISKVSLHNAEAHLKLAKTKLQGGVTLQLEVKSAALQVTTAKQQLLQAQNGLLQARLALALLLNRERFGYTLQQPSSLQMPQGSAKDWFKTALKNRYDLKAAQVEVRLARKQLQRVWLSYLPTVSVNAALQGQNATGFSGQNFNWNVGVVAQFNLYGGGMRALQVKSARSKLMEARIKQIQVVRKLKNDLAVAAMGHTNAKSELKVAQQRNALAKSNYEFAQNQYQAGLITSTKVLDSLKMYRGAQIAMLRAQLNVDLAILKLRRDLGLFHP